MRWLEATVEQQLSFLRGDVHIRAMQTIRVKICGITNPEDAWAAVEHGASALGFMFFEGSSRWVTTEQAAEIIESLPPFIAKVGVFVNPSAEEVRRVIGETGVDTLQFHGEEEPAFCRGFGLKAIKAFRVRDESVLEELRKYGQEAWLLDSYVAGQQGGTGQPFRWEIARAAVPLGRKVILAGGLTPENVGAAIRAVQPYGVDVSSGVESAPGKKDAEKMKRFLEACSSVNCVLSYGPGAA